MNGDSQRHEATGTPIGDLAAAVADELCGRIFSGLLATLFDALL